MGDPETGRLEIAEEGWERTRPLPDPRAAAVRRRLAPWPGLDPARAEVLGGGLRSLNLRFGDVVARVALGDDHALALEAALLRRMEGRVRVPRLLERGEGALLLEFVPHERLHSDAAAGRRAGRAAARIHAERMPQPGFLDASLRVARPFACALEGLRAWADGALAGAAGRRLGSDAGRVAALWSRETVRLRESCEQPVLLHADYKPANVKDLPGEGDQVLVLDWEFAWSGPALFDAGQMLRWSPPDPFVRGFAAGYRDAGGELPRDWSERAELFDLFNLVGFLDHEEPRPRRDRDVLRRVAATLAAYGA